MLDQGTSYADLVRFAVFESQGGPVPDGATITSAKLSIYSRARFPLFFVLQGAPRLD